MERIPLPNKVQFEELGNNKYQVIMEPLYPGYGVTIGNSLRRILLSSLPGAAVTAVRIKGVDHEFSTVPNVKEDVIEIILNLKQLRMKMHTDQAVTLECSVKGEKVVTAADFKKNSDVEIVNTDLHVATLDNKGADFDMEVIVQQGRGYVPVEQRENEKLEIGMIAVDAIYTPMKTVNFEVKNVRVGQITNFDQLTLTLETDGTIDGKSAIDASAKILLDHFNMFTTTSMDEQLPAPVLNVEAEEGIKAPEEDDLKSLGLSNRSYNALIKNNITRISDLQKMNHDDFLKIEGLGDKSIEEIERLISTYNQ
ncbi:MAG: DNA-directed RNA polymerase subunit alpha [Candidatus Doudnabacteria bacterium]|nr:DNA-directed RNA polymerase subunit alpha [Candidatus Doudnabacteria bacterium]